MSKWNELTMSQRNELLGIYAKQGYKNLNAIKQHYNQFADGGNKTNLAVPTQQRDAVQSYTPREQVKARQLTPEEQYNIYRQENTIQPMTPEQKYKMGQQDLMEKAFSERYAQKRIDAAKKGIAATTAVTSYVPGPIGAASRGVNLLLDVADFVDSPRDMYNTANAGTGVARTLGTSNVTRHIPKVGIVVDNTLDVIGHIDEADDISLGEVSKKVKQTINNKAYGGYVGNYGEVSSEIKHNVQHMNQPFFYNNNPSNTIHREDFNSFNNGGNINSSTLKQNNLNTQYNTFADGGNSVPRMLQRPVPQNVNTQLFKKSNTPVLPINHLITTPSNTKQVVTPKVASRNTPAFLPEKMLMDVTPLDSESTSISKQGDTILRQNPVINEVLEKNDKIISKNRKEVLDNPKVEVDNKSLISDYAKTKSKRDEEERNNIMKSLYKNYDTNNKEQVKQIQKQLVDKGYDIGNSGVNKDGVDGKFGDKTKKAYEDMFMKEHAPKTQIPTKIMENITKQGKACEYDNEQCATFVSDVYKYNVLGNAWEMKDNIEKNNGIIKYNIYDDARFKNAKDANSLKKITQEVKAQNKASKEMFQVGDVVGLYWKGSSYHQTALKDGKGGTHNTHVGYVSSIDKDGNPIITHNVHGKLRHDKYNNVTIGWIGTPKFESYEYKNTAKSTKPIDIIKHYSDSMIKDFDVDVTPEQVQKDVYGILKLETNLGKLKPTEQDIKTSQIAKNILGKNSDIKSISQGIGKLKINTLTQQEQDFLGLDEKTINNEETAIKASTYLYLKNLKTFKEYAKQNPQLKLTDQDIRDMTILSYNQGTSKLLNLGYNNARKSIAEEVETLRELKSDKKIHDISSTKLQYLPSFIGEALYDKKYEGGHTSYINRVLKHGEKLKDAK